MVGTKGKLFWSLSLQIAGECIPDTPSTAEASLYIVCLQWQQFLLKLYEFHSEFYENEFHNSIQDWVFTIVYSCRKVLVKMPGYLVCNFQEKSHIQSDSWTTSKECLPIILAIISSANWLLNSIDIKTAFLQIKKIDRDIFIVPPIEASTKNKVWKLERCVYSFNNAAYMWYFAVWEHLEYLGCKHSSLDYGVFTWYNENNDFYGIFQSNICDFLWTGNEKFKWNMWKNYEKNLKLGNIQFKLSNMLA